MKIIHSIEDYSLMSGGLRTVIKDLHHKLKEKEVESFVLTTKAEPEDDVITVPRSLYKGIWCYSREFVPQLLKLNADIHHIHGIWMHPPYVTAKKSLQTGTPFLITPHGMLEPRMWKDSTTKKNVYFNFLIKKLFKQANVIHAITSKEKDNLYKLFAHKRIEIIPNSISYTDIDNYGIRKQDSEKYILFVGRLHPVKGINLLIKAFAKLKNKEVKLKIAGPYNEYKIELEKLVNSLGIQDQVQFLGMVTGEDKLQLYKDAWVFAAPSYSEAIGMVNLEAGILSTPVITTYETGLYKEWNNEGGILINPDVEELYAKLKESLSWSEKERNEKGDRLRNFIIENYSWEKNIYKWIELYKSIL